MPDDWQIFLEPPYKIAADDLNVIEIELNAHIRPSDLANDIGGLLDAREEIIRSVARIDRLDQQRNATLTCHIGRPREIAR